MGGRSNTSIPVHPLEPMIRAALAEAGRGDEDFIVEGPDTVDCLVSGTRCDEVFVRAARLAVLARYGASAPVACTPCIEAAFDAHTCTDGLCSYVTVAEALNGNICANAESPVKP